MAITLRDTFGVNIGNDDAAIAAEQARARDMWAPTKAYAAGRVNNDINYNNAAEAGLRAAGRVAEADALAAETAALNQRQAMYAPEVGKVEDIRGVGDAFSWLGTQVGQGAASMQDPMALSAVAQGVGTLTSKVPGLRGIGALAPLAGALGAYGINQRQMTGEMYGRLKEDPQAMANMTPAQANLYSNLYGVGAGALDTVLPHVAGRAIGGAALTKGLAQSAARNFSPLTRTLAAAGLEGSTELGQQEMQIRGHDMINPLRNRDEDFSERLNAFAGGAAGGLGPSAAGALASTAYSGANRVGEVVSEKAGEMVDLAGSKLPGAQQAVGDAVDAAKDAVEKSGAKTKLGDIIDIGKQAWGDVKGLREGPEDREGALTAARAQYERYSLSPEMRSVIDAVPGPDDDVATWSTQNVAEKQRLIPEHMDMLAEAGDERAKALADAIYGEDPVASLDAIEEAGRYLQDRDIVAQQDLRTAAAQHRVGGVTQRLVRGATKAAMTAAGAVGSMAKVVGNAAADGAREGAQAAKRNMQGAGITTLDYDSWKADRDKNALPTDTPEAQRTHAIQKAVEGRSAKAALEPKFQEDPEAKARSRERATLFAEIMAAEATSRRAKLIGTQADDGVADFTNFVRGIGYEVSDMAEAWAARGAESKSKRPTERDAAQAENSVSLLDSLAGDMILATGEMAPSVAARMAEGADAAQKPFWSMLQERIDNWDETQGDREQARMTMQDRMVALLPQEDQADLLKGGGAGAKQLLEFVQQIGRGKVSRAQRKALEGHIGADALNKMLTIAGAAEEQRRGVTPGETAEDAGAARPMESDAIGTTEDGGFDTDAAAAETSAFEQRAAERKADKNRAPRMYMFHGEGANSVRTTDSARRNPRDPFEAKESAGGVKTRPRLVRLNGQDDEAANESLSKKVAEMEANLGIARTPENFLRLATAELRGAADGKTATEKAANVKSKVDYLSKVAAAAKDGNEAAQARLDEMMERFFATRGTEYSVDTVSASQVMDDMGMPGTRRLSLFREYMAQDARRAEGKDPARAEKLRALARLAAAQLVDEGEGKGSDLFARNAAVNRRGDQRLSEADTKLESAVPGDAKTIFRLPPGERRQLATAMQRYFDEGYLVAAQQNVDRVPGSMATGELMELARAGAKARSSGQGQGRMARNDDVSESVRRDTEGDLLNFPQRKGANILGTKDTTLTIKASALVAWVRNQRRETNTEKLGEEKAYVRDLLEGIAAVTNMDAVSGAPWVNGKHGKEAFTARGVPGSLQLPGRAGWQAERSRQERVEARVGKALKETDDAARDAELSAEPDWFVVDPLQGAEDSVTYREGREAGDMTVADYANRGQPALAGRAVGEGRTTRAGERWRDTPTAPVNEQANRNHDDVTPLDTKLAKDEGQAEFDDQKMRSAGDDRGIGRESPIKALDKAADRGDAVAVYRKERPVTNDGGRLSRVDRDLDYRATMKNIQRRLDAANGKAKEKSTPKYEAAFSYGAHYIYPLAHALSVKNVESMLESLTPLQGEVLIKKQAEVAHFLATEVPAGPRLQLARAMAKGMEDVKDYAAADKFLSALADTSMAAEKAAAREVAAKGPKSSSAPAGAPNHAIAHRVRERAALGNAKVADDVRLLAKVARDLLSAMSDRSRAEALNHPELSAIMGRLVAAKLAGKPGADAAIAAVNGAVVDAFGLPTDKALNKQIRFRAEVGTILEDVMSLIAKAESMPEGARAVARAVRRVAGGSKFGIKPMGPGAFGEFDPNTGSTYLAEVADGNAAHTALHEGVHAATMRGLAQNKELYQATYDLMDHVAKHDKDLAAAYGMTNVLEFVAEAMSNQQLQRRLYKIPASKKVEQYLGRTVANAWDAFVALVGKALGLPEGRNSALNQIIELSGRAMKATGQAGDLTAGMTGPQYAARMLETKADPARTEEAMAAIAEHPAFAEGEGKKFIDALKTDSDPDQLGRHITLRALEDFRHVLGDAPTGMVGMNDAMGVFGGVFNALLQEPSSPIAHRMSDQIHEELGNAGFGATHDSPTRHDGRFDWRKHIGSGEGQAVFGAGTYLSTADETHDFYKQQFSVGSRGFEYKGKLRTAAVDPGLNAAERMVLNTLLLDPSMTAEDAKANAARFLPNLVQLGEVERPAGKTMQQFIQETSDAITPGMVGEFKRPDGASPTYHVSVNAGPTEIMGWDAPFREQPWPVQAAMYDAASVAKVADPTDGESGAQFYKRLVSKLGSQRVASEALQGAGVVGHAYGASGGTERQYPNYVIYDDARIKTNYVHFNRQKVNEDVAPDHAQIAEAKAYLNRVLGGQIKAEFKEITGYSGEWVEAENAVRVSTITSAGTMNVARHEALHAFFSKFIKANPRVVRALSSLTDDPRVVRRLEALLADDPAALAQLADGEERLAYIYQFAMAGVMSLPRTAGTTVMSKVRKFLRRVFMMVSDQERAVDLLYAFEHGEMSQPSSAQKAVARVMAQGTWASGMARKMDAITQRAAALTVPAETILAVSKSPTAQKIGRLFFTNPGDETAVGEGGRHGYINDRNQKMRQYDNLFRETVAELDDQQMSSLIDVMQRELPADQVKDPAVADARKRLRGMFERFHRYLTDEKGLPISKINENYFPVVWDSHRIAQDPSQFADMLRAKYSDVIADMAKSWARERDDFYAATGGAPSNLEVIDSDFVIHELTSRVSRGAGVDDEGIYTPTRQDGVLRPWMAASKKRTLNFITPEDRAPFLEKNLVKTLTRYVRQGVHTAEYAQRFGREGEDLSEMLAQAKTELQAEAKRMKAEGEFKTDKARDDWVRRQYRDVANSVGGMEGSLGNDVKDWQRNINSWTIVYQNVRLLPLALFSSFVDPLGLVARGGTMKEAFTTFVEGMRGVARQWGDMIREVPADRRKDQWEALAEHAGVIDGAVFSHLISDEYGSVYLEGKTKKINEIMFKANGMEAWNRAMRVGATRSAVAFIERHAKLPDQHSRRWLQELGLDPNRLPMDSDGKLITDRSAMQAAFPDMSRGEAEEATARVHSALVRWVEGAVLSPNAAQRPAWGSDPHYSMFWHLKQFAYSFHQTLIKRAMQEAKHGNYMPLGVFGWYIPTMIAADVTKGLMMGGGSLPNYMQGYDLGDWVVHGVDRAGVLGIGQVGLDTMKDPTGVAGPAVEQILDVFTDPVEKTMTGALPMHSLTGKVFS